MLLIKQKSRETQHSTGTIVSHFVSFNAAILRLLGWMNHWTCFGTSLKFSSKSIHHRLGCIRIKNLSQIYCNFCSQGHSKWWHYVSHNAILLPLVILNYYQVCSSYFLRLAKMTAYTFWETFYSFKMFLRPLLCILTRVDNNWNWPYEHCHWTRKLVAFNKKHAV